MATIEAIVRSIQRDLTPAFEERLRAALADQDREWLIDQIVRLTLDAHSLEEIDRRSVVEAEGPGPGRTPGARPRHGARRGALERFLGEYAGRHARTADRRTVPARRRPGQGHRPPDRRSPVRAGDALLQRAKDVLFGLLFGDESAEHAVDRVQQELLTVALPRPKASAPRLHACVDRAERRRHVAGPRQRLERRASRQCARSRSNTGRSTASGSGAGIVGALSLINNLEVNEQVLYARMINLEETTLIH